MGSCVSRPDNEDIREASPLGSFFALPEPGGHGSLQPVQRAGGAKSEEQPRTPTIQPNPNPTQTNSPLAPRASAQMQQLLVSANSDLSPSRRSMYEHFFESQLLGLTSLQEELLLLKDLRLFALLGRGGFAATFLGSWREGVPVAAKLILSSPQQQQQQQQQQNAQHGQQLHPYRSTAHQQAREVLLSKLQRPGFAASTHPAVVQEDAVLLSSDLQPPRTSMDMLDTSLLDSGFPSSALTEALLCKQLSHPNIVTTFTVRCASVSALFIAAARYGNLPRAQLVQKLQAMWQSMSPSQQLGVGEVERLADQVAELVVNWHGCTPLHPPHRDQDLRRSSSSHDGFGNPNEAREPLSWQEVLQQVGGKAGDLITVLVMRYCDLGTLETAILRGVFHGAGDHAIVHSATSHPSLHDLFSGPHGSNKRRPLSTPLPAVGANAAALSGAALSLDPSSDAPPPGVGSPPSSAYNSRPASPSQGGRPASRAPSGRSNNQEQDAGVQAASHQPTNVSLSSGRGGDGAPLSDSHASSSCANSDQHASVVQAAKDRRQRLRAVLRTAREIAQALEHLHEWNVVHGDLKPANVLLASSRQDARGFTALVADFGLSMLVGSHPEVVHNNQGTIQYMAPEMLRAPGRVSPAADIYALGITLWTMLTARCPYEGIPNEQVVLGVTQHGLRPRWPSRALPALEQLYLRCVAHNPTDRPSAAQLVRLLSQLESEVRKDPGSRSHRRANSGPDVSAPVHAAAAPGSAGAAHYKCHDSWSQSSHFAEEFEQRLKQQQEAAAARLRAFAMASGIQPVPARDTIPAMPAILSTAATSVPVTPLRSLPPRQPLAQGNWFPRPESVSSVQSPGRQVARRSLDMEQGGAATSKDVVVEVGGSQAAAAARQMPGYAFLQGSPQRSLQGVKQIKQGPSSSDVAPVAAQAPSPAHATQAAQQRVQVFQAATAQQQQLARQLARQQQVLQQQQMAQQQQQAVLLPQLLQHQRSQQEAERRMQQLVLGLSRSAVAAAASTSSHLLIAEAVQRMQQQQGQAQQLRHQDLQPSTGLQNLTHATLQQHTMQLVHAQQQQLQQQQQQQAVISDLLQQAEVSIAPALPPVQEEVPSRSSTPRPIPADPFARQAVNPDPLTMTTLAAGADGLEPLLPEVLSMEVSPQALEPVISAGRQPMALTPVASEGSRTSLHPTSSGGHPPSITRQGTLELVHSGGGRAVVVLEPVTSGDYQSLAPELLLEPRMSHHTSLPDPFFSSETNSTALPGLYQLEPAASGASEMQLPQTRSVTITPLIIPAGTGMAVTSPGMSVTLPDLVSPTEISPSTISPSVGPNSIMSSAAVTTSSMARSAGQSLHTTQHGMKPWELQQQPVLQLLPHQQHQQPGSEQRQRRQQREREHALQLQQMQVNFPSSWAISPPVSLHDAPLRSDTAFTAGQSWAPFPSETSAIVDSRAPRRYETSTSIGSAAPQRLDTATSMDSFGPRRFNTSTSMDSHHHQAQRSDTATSMDNLVQRRLVASTSANATGPRRLHTSGSVGSAAAPRRRDTSISLGGPGLRRLDSSMSVDSQRTRHLNMSTSIGSTGMGPRRYETSSSVGSSRSRQLMTAASIESNYQQALTASMSMERSQPRRLDTAASFEAGRPNKVESAIPVLAPQQVAGQQSPPTEAQQQQQQQPSAS